MVLELEPPRNDGPYLRRAEQAARPILETLARKDRTYTITVLDSDHPNAFSHPGGYIYVTKGLFDLIGDDEDEDFVLQFAIAHEVAHVELQHAIKCLNDPDLSKSGLGTLPQFSLFLFPLGYPDAMDFEADRWAYDRLTHQLQPHAARAASLSSAGSRAMPKRNGFENGRPSSGRWPTRRRSTTTCGPTPAVYQRLDELTRKAAKTSP